MLVELAGGGEFGRGFGGDQWSIICVKTGEKSKKEKKVLYKV